MPSGGGQGKLQAREEGIRVILTGSSSVTRPYADAYRPIRKTADAHIATT